MLHAGSILVLRLVRQPGPQREKKKAFKTSTGLLRSARGQGEREWEKRRVVKEGSKTDGQHCDRVASDGIVRIGLSHYLKGHLQTQFEHF